MRHALPAFAIAVSAMSLTIHSVAAQQGEPAPEATPITAEDPVHNELRALRDGVVDAVNRGDLDKLVTYCHPDIALTTPDAVVSRGRAGVKGYYQSKMEGPERVVDSFSSQPTVDELATIFDGNTAVATGTSVDHFKLTSGLEFDLNTRWSATLVRQDGQWLIANYHTATDVFDNPLLNRAKQGLYWALGGGLLVGLIIGLLIGRLTKRRAPAAQPS